MRTFPIALITSFFAYSAAQSAGLGSILSGISSTCQSSLLSLLSSDVATCLNIISFTGILSTNGSLITPLNSYIAGICPAAPCSDAVLQNATSTIQQGCSSESDQESEIPVALEAVFKYYGSIKELLCLQAKSNSTYCLTNVLTNAQSDAGFEFSTSNLLNLFSNQAGLTQFLSNVSSSAICTDCGSAIAHVGLGLYANISDENTDTATEAIESRCYAGFSTSIPDTVNDASNATANTNSSSSGNTTDGGSGASTAGNGANGVVPGGILVPMVALLASGLAVIS